MSVHMLRESGHAPGLVEAAAPGLPITLADVGVWRGDVTLLRGVDLTIAPRQCTVVIGPNGAGKSTLLRVLHGLIAPSAGRIAWGHLPTPPRNQAMVFQRPVLLRRSAAANIEYALRLAGFPEHEWAARAFSALEHAGLASLARRPARRLSGGEQQRVALARAAALEPAVLFLDEPTASLDPAASRAIEERVQAIRATGTTLVMSTHNLAQARRVAERVVFLQAGRVLEITPAVEFFRGPRTDEAAAFLDGERV